MTKNEKEWERKCKKLFWWLDNKESQNCTQCSKSRSESSQGLKLVGVSVFCAVSLSIRIRVRRMRRILYYKPAEHSTNSEPQNTPIVVFELNDIRRRLTLGSKIVKKSVGNCSHDWFRPSQLSFWDCSKTRASHSNSLTAWLTEWLTEREKAFVTLLAPSSLSI